MHAWARAAVRKTLSRAVKRQLEDMERAARLKLAVPATAFDARVLLSEAQALRADAMRAGLLPRRVK